MSTSGFEKLDANTIARLQGEWEEETLRRREADPVGHFPWHQYQSFLLYDAHALFPNPVRTIIAWGGNRSGKSGVAKGIYSSIMDRTSPINPQFRTTDRFTGKVRGMTDQDALRVWVVPPTGEKYREDWVNPADGMGIQFWLGDRYLHHRSSPDDVFLSRPPGLTEAQCRQDNGKVDETRADRTVGKSQDQKLHTFESSEIHAAFVDEEPLDPVIWRSIMMRMGTSNGVGVLSFTPLLGLSWSYDLWYKPLVKQGKATTVKPRCWVHVPDDPAAGATIATQMHMADNPRARVYAQEIVNDPQFGEAEKAARVYGTYGFVEGALVPQLAGMDVESPNSEHEIYVTDQLPGRTSPGPNGGRVGTRTKPHVWRLVADPNKSYGGLLTMLDSDGNLFVIREHLEVDWPNRKHAKAFEEMMNKEAGTGPREFYADPGSAGAQSILDLEDFGLPFVPVSKGSGSVSRSIKRLRSLAYVDPEHMHPITGKYGAPRIYFFAPGMVSTWEEKGIRITGCRLTDQISAARQQEGSAHDTPDKDAKNKLDLWDCLRYAADMALASSEDVQDDSRLYHEKENFLPRDSLTLSPEESIMHPLHQDMEFPNYDFY